MSLEKLLQELESTEVEYKEALSKYRQEGSSLLRTWRESKGWSLRHLADILGYDFTYISKIENGHMPLSRKLGRKLYSLMSDVDTE